MLMLFLKLGPYIRILEEQKNTVVAHPVQNGNVHALAQNVLRVARGWTAEVTFGAAITMVLSTQSISAAIECQRRLWKWPARNHTDPKILVPRSKPLAPRSGLRYI